ncbi:MAG TPA: hypothetical protein ENK17_01535, partial [Anaerolineae bacterium]|nr:hypothetical protein [Anaerolineae bacterium]
DLVLLRGAGHTSYQIAIFYQENRALGAPVFRTAEDGGFLAHGLAVGDVTGDGRDDVVVTAGGNTPHAYLNVFPQGADGSLVLTPTVYPAFHLPEAVEIGDVNHDGRNDVVNVHAAWMSLSVYTQTVSGALSAYERYPLPYTDYYRPAGLALADVSHDGALDVLIASHSSLSAENGLVVLTNSGDAPTSTITVPAAGVYITDTALFPIQGRASTADGVLEVSTDGGQTWQSRPAAAAWTFTWTAPLTDGSYILLSRLTDAAGVVQAPPARSRAIVDHTPPLGSLLINDGAVYTNRPTVTLTVDGSDFNGLAAMRFANQGSGYDAWATFAPTYTWTLTGADGLKTVTGQVRDVPGNTGEPFSDTIILDTTGPTCGILINGDATYASSTQVTLTLTSTDTYGVAQVRVRNAGGTWSAWQPYVSTLAWNLGGSDGARSVEAQFRDVAGNDSAVCSDAIILDTTPPSCGIIVAGDATYTTQPTVPLTLNSSDANGVAQMRFSDDGSNWSAWEPYTTTRTWTLPSPDGPKSVHARFQDNAGNFSPACQDDIILDTTPPSGFVLIEGGALYTGIPTVTLTLGASDAYGVTQMRFSNDGLSWESWQSYAVN